MNRGMKDSDALKIHASRLRGGRPRSDVNYSLLYLFLLKLSAQLAVFLQQVVYLRFVLLHHLPPQIDVTLGLDWNDLVLVLLIFLIQLLCLCCLFHFNVRSDRISTHTHVNKFPKSIY